MKWPATEGALVSGAGPTFRVGQRVRVVLNERNRKDFLLTR